MCRDVRGGNFALEAATIKFVQSLTLLAWCFDSTTIQNCQLMFQEAWNPKFGWRDVYSSQQSNIYCPRIQVNSPVEFYSTTYTKTVHP